MKNYSIRHLANEKLSRDKQRQSQIKYGLIRDKVRFYVWKWTLYSFLDTMFLICAVSSLNPDNRI